jgi:hypothetical protein
MKTPHPATTAWETWWTHLDALDLALKNLSKRRTTHVKAASTRECAKAVVQYYFREVRQGLLGLRISENRIEEFDYEMQELIKMASKVTRVSTYRRSMKFFHAMRAPLEAAIEISAVTANDSTIFTPTTVESTFLKTLDQIVPNAALSYQQVLQDLREENRVSLRGTASELREILREVLDHLAPDESVAKSPGFKLEHGQTKPTMKQKAIFILRARGQNETQRKTASDATEAVENAVGSLARSVYNRGSLSTHLSTARHEVLTFKGYLEAVLAELLEVHSKQSFSTAKGTRKH